MKRLETLVRVGIISTILSSPLVAESPGSALIKGIVGAAISGAADEAGRVATQEAVKELKKTPIPTPTPISPISSTPPRVPIFCIAYERREDLNRDGAFEYPTEFMGIGTKFSTGFELAYFNDYCTSPEGEMVTQTILDPQNQTIMNQQKKIMPNTFMHFPFSHEAVKKVIATYGAGTYTWIVQSPKYPAQSIQFEILPSSVNAQSLALEQKVGVIENVTPAQKLPEFYTFTRWRDVNQDDLIQREELFGYEQRTITQKSEFNFAWNNTLNSSQEVTMGIYTNSGDLISEKTTSVPPRSTWIIRNHSSPLHELLLQQPGTYTVIGCAKEATPYRFDLTLKEDSEHELQSP